MNHGRGSCVYKGNSGEEVAPIGRTLAGPDADTRRAELLRIEGVMYPASLCGQPKLEERGSRRHGLLAPSRQAET